MGKLSNLPSEILLEILSRLPTEEVLECKLVCKPWRNLVSRHPSFCRMHLTHLNGSAASKLSFLLLTPYRPFAAKHQQFHYIGCNKNNDLKTSITRMNINLPFKNYSVIGSCNGLICLSALHVSWSSDSQPQPACVCNPITKEYVMLPKLERNPVDYRVYSGFGYLRETNEYKVVRIAQLKGKPAFECVEVYTLGSGNGWIKIVVRYGLKCSVDSFSNANAVFVNETLYWITSQGKIVAFNLADETFYIFPTPPCRSLADTHRPFYQIGVLGGFLWCSFTQFNSERTDIWLLKKIGNQHMMEHEEYLSLDWSEEFNLVSMKPLASLKSDKLLFFGQTYLSSYDIKSSSLKTLFKFPEYFCQASPHKNTLVSLKALGEVDTKTME